MAAYISVTFEKNLLSTSSLARVVTRSIDMGDVPPPPSPTYFPTMPDSLANFIVVEYVSDVIGERLSRIATLSDVVGLSVLPLNTFESLSTDFVAAGVVAGDLLSVFLTDPQLWTSTEYPTSSPFIFPVVSVLSSTQITVALPFPAFRSSASWSIVSRGISGSDGVTRRLGSPIGPVEFLDSRFDSYFSNAVDAESYVAAAKANLVSLANSSTGSTFTTESYTASPTV